MATVKKSMKKAQEGAELRRGQYKRLGRIEEKNPVRAERVAERMNKRASRVDRGRDVAGRSYQFKTNPSSELKEAFKFLDSKKEMKNGGKLAAGVGNQKPKKAGKVDPKGAYTKVQTRTLGKAKSGTKTSKKK